MRNLFTTSLSIWSDRATCTCTRTSKCKAIVALATQSGIATPAACTRCRWIPLSNQPESLSRHWWPNHNPKKGSGLGCTSRFSFMEEQNLRLASLSLSTGQRGIQRDARSQTILQTPSTRHVLPSNVRNYQATLIVNFQAIFQVQYRAGLQTSTGESSDIPGLSQSSSP